MESKWGYIDDAGKILINYQFKKATAFSDGLALVVNDDDKVGYINLEGKYIIKAQYKNGLMFSEGLAAVVPEDSGPIYINTSGETKIKLPNDIISAFAFAEGLAQVIDSKGKFGFIDKDGKLKISCQYEEAGFFSEGLAYVKTKDKYGFIDKDGKIVINYQFDQVGWFSEGLAKAGDSKKVGFIDKSGNYSIPPQFDDVWFFRNGIANVQSGKKWGYIDNKGKIVINPQYDISFPFIGEFSTVGSSKNMSIIDREGKEVGGNGFKGLVAISPKLVLTVAENDKCGLADIEGKILINPQFDKFDISIISNTFARIVSEPSFVESDIYDIQLLVSRILEGTNSSSFMSISAKTTMAEFNSNRIDSTNRPAFIISKNTCRTVQDKISSHYSDQKKTSDKRSLASA